MLIPAPSVADFYKLKPGGRAVTTLDMANRGSLVDQSARRRVDRHVSSENTVGGRRKKTRAPGSQPARGSNEGDTTMVAEPSPTGKKKPPAPEPREDAVPHVDLSIESPIGGSKLKLIATCNGRTFTDEAPLRNSTARAGSAKRLAEQLEISESHAAEIIGEKVNSLVIDTGKSIVTSAAEVTTTDVSWLWYARIPLGSLTIIDGLPGCGKSTFTTDLAARVSRGWRMPPHGGGSDEPAAGVLIISAEDDAATTIVPRLRESGADLHHTHLMTTVETEGRQRPLSIPVDVPRIESVVVEHGVKLVIIDPIMAYLGESVESHVDSSVRNALVPLVEMAARNQAAVLLIRHLNKKSGEAAINRGGGSIAFVAAARSGLLLGRHPDDPGKRVLASVKCNLAAEAKSLEFRIVPRGSVATCEWIGVCDVTAEDLVSIKRKKRESATKDDAIELYKGALKDGPRPSVELTEIMESAGVSESTAGRARKAMGLTKNKPGLADGWEWAMPDGQGMETN